MKTRPKKEYVGFRLPTIILKKVDVEAKLNGLSRSEQIRQNLITLYGIKNATTEKN